MGKYMEAVDRLMGALVIEGALHELQHVAGSATPASCDRHITMCAGMCSKTALELCRLGYETHEEREELKAAIKACLVLRAEVTGVPVAPHPDLEPARAPEKSA